MDEGQDPYRPSEIRGNNDRFRGINPKSHGEWYINSESE